MSRRELMSGVAAALVLAPSLGAAATPAALQALSATRNAAFSLNEPPAKFEHAMTYNNFYEFGLGKEDPSR
ncbi:MAG: protein-methionine-sulfoxide reductase catalytic subunit MsrP, partial [Candidatus Rokuibacteriota bacterium]